MPTSHGFVENLAELARSGTPFVSVTMVDAVGSTPQDIGSKMLVTAKGFYSGTVGGGKVEFKAIQHAQSLLALHGSDAIPHHLVEWNLQRDVGMTCGGVVKLFFESYNHCDWRVVIFGAGHIANAVVECLGQLECQTTCIDPRPEWLAKISDRERLKKVQSVDMPSHVAELPDDAFVLCMTMGHATDRPILAEIFRRGRKFPYLGVIGSKAKRSILVRELAAEGFNRDQIEAFHCPIGLPLGTNQPGEIAVSVVAQLIQERDRWRVVARS
jgi:xanthine dehydrogenase accessory factor